MSSIEFFSPCTELSKRKMGNAKKTIKYYCKHNSLQQIYIWFCIPYCPEVCWHGKALRPEEWAIKHAAPCWYRNCRSQWCNCLPQWNHRLVLTPKIPYWSSWLQSQQLPCSQHTIRGTAQRTQFQISFICWDMWLFFFFFFECLLQLQLQIVDFPYTKSLSLLTSFHQLSF